jgi:predicted membrane channel-forming protein YqfA (hemolysin III family)
MSKSLKVAAILLVTGLAIEALTLLWNHPLAFVSFIVPGGVLILAGVLIYVWSLLSRGAAT